MQQWLIDVAEGAADQVVAGVAELLFTQDTVQVGQVAATQLAGHVECVQAQFLGLLVDSERFVFGQEALVFKLVFEGAEFFGDESTHGVDHHFLFVVEGKVHGVLSVNVSVQWPRSRPSQSTRGTGLARPLGAPPEGVWVGHTQ